MDKINCHKIVMTNCAIKTTTRINEDKIANNKKIVTSKVYTEVYHVGPEKGVHCSLKDEDPY